HPVIQRHIKDNQGLLRDQLLAIASLERDEMNEMREKAQQTAEYLEAVGGTALVRAVRCEFGSEEVNFVREHIRLNLVGEYLFGLGLRLGKEEKGVRNLSGKAKEARLKAVILENRYKRSVPEEDIRKWVADFEIVFKSGGLKNALSVARRKRLDE